MYNTTAELLGLEEGKKKRDLVPSGRRGIGKYGLLVFGKAARIHYHEVKKGQN